MKRRDFIRMGSFITVSAAALGVTGCNSDSDSAISRPMPPLATGGTWLFPQSIASGDPHADSIMLWTRVTSSALAVTAESSLSVAVELRITTADNSASLGSSTALTGVTLPTVTVPAYGDFDGTVRHKLTGLTAGTVYYYQFTAGTVLSKVGRFKTAQAAASNGDVKFAFMSCQEWSNNHWGAFSQIVADDVAPATPNLDFVVHLGDYIYETDAASSAEGLHSVITLPNGTSIPPAISGDGPGGKYASELVDYRYLYKLYRSDARIQAMHERFPMIAVWDDHEFSDDAWQASETYSNANASQPDRRRNANQAWFEFMPADIAFSETDSSFSNIRIYRDMQFGTVMHLIMTDERLYRTDHVIAETTVSNGAQLGRINSRYLAPEGTHKLLENIKSTVFPDPLQAITMLGATQRDWWKTTMSGSTASWKVWGNEVSLLRMGLNGSKAVVVLVGLGAISGASASMTAAQASTSVQALPKVAAGALAAIGAGASAAVAIPASFAILQTLAATSNPAAAVTAGENAGLTNAQANAALGAILAKSPTAAEVAICATTVVAATTAYMSTSTAAVPVLQAAASTTAAGVVVSILVANAAYGGAPAALFAAAKGSSTTIGDFRAMLLVNVYTAARDASGSNQIKDGYTAFTATSVTTLTSETLTTATGVMLSLVKAEVDAAITASSLTASSFVAASGQGTLLSAFMRKFLVNADQWDGYGRERSNLMQHLLDNDIDNVVAITGDIHAFFAGEVYNKFPGAVATVSNAGAELTAIDSTYPPADPVIKAAMVDLVTAGISSTSFANYLSTAAAALSASLVTLVSYTLVGTTNATPTNPSLTGFTFDVVLPVLDFTLGKAFSGAALVGMIRDAIKLATAANGIPESAFEAGAGATITQVATAIAATPALQALCYELSGLGVAANPWLKHVDTNAQGYAVVTATTGSMQCKFKKVNALFTFAGTGYAPVVHPADSRTTIVNTTTTIDITAGSTTLAIS